MIEGNHCSTYYFKADSGYTIWVLDTTFSATNGYSIVQCIDAIMS